MKKFYAVKSSNNDIRIHSSSGGFFQVISNYFLENNGVVYGAIYDENLKVVHSRATNYDELKMMSGSKYSQSYLGDVFINVKNDLNNGKKVLFSGTPCQINSLKLFVKNNLDNLYTIDVICHGVPNSKFLSDYIKYQESKLDSKVIDINMRYKYFQDSRKKNNIHSSCPVEKKKMLLRLESGKQYIKSSEFDIYYQLFDYFINSGCFKCPFANLNRVGDITIGDFHEYNSKLGEFNDGNGVSLVIINSEKGGYLFNKIRLHLIIEEKSEFECLQPSLIKPTVAKEDYDSFHRDYNKYGFNYIVKKYGKHGFKYKIKEFLYTLNLLK